MRLNKYDKLLVSSKCKLFETAGAEQLNAQPPKDVREQVVSSRLTCIDDRSEREGGATVSIRRVT